MAAPQVPVERVERCCLDWLAQADPESHPIALLSAGPVREDARFSILACEPDFVVQGRLFDGGGRFFVEDGKGARVAEHSWENLLPVLRELEAEWAPGLDGALPRPFGGGWIGAFGYDLAWLFEYGLPRYLAPSSPLPDLWLAWYSAPLVVDRKTGIVRGSDDACADFVGSTGRHDLESFTVAEIAPAFHREDYEAAVERIRRHCVCGDLFQADLSRRIEFEFSGDPRLLFERLVEASPAACMAYLGLGESRAIVSASPEEYIRLSNGQLRSRPIKGTRPRGLDADDDDRLRLELCASEKDLAELTMIVDLVRNDLGRVAVPGSVEVGAFPQVLGLPQVWHLAADVTARLDPARDFWDVLACSFPPGSIVGAPKPRAIEILERVERTRRGIYTGAIGYIEPGGDAHLNVAIRTAEIGEGRLRFGVGGGITALSDPALEYQETCDKAAGLIAALGIAVP